MSFRAIPGQLVAENDADGVARAAAGWMQTALKTAVATRGAANLALSGGNTPREAYAILAGATGLDWNKVQIFWVDERAVPPDDERSNYRWAKATLIDRAPVPAAQVHRMPADAADLASAAKAYEAVLVSRIGPDASGTAVLDVVVLGIGEDGHTASLFPGDPTVDVIDRQVAAVSAQPGREARMTLTRPVILAARLVLVLAVGAGKRKALDRAWAPEGDVHETPSRIVRDCAGQVVWILDAAAAAP